MLYYVHAENSPIFPAEMHEANRVRVSNIEQVDKFSRFSHAREKKGFYNP